MELFEIEDFGVEELREEELDTFSGGGVWDYVVSIGISMVENWQDIREGFSHGLNGKTPRY